MSGALLGVIMGGMAGNAFVIVGTSVDATGGGGDPVVTKPAGVVAGDLLIAVMAATFGTFWTPEAGWTELVDQGSRPSLAAARKTAGGAEPADYDFGNASSTGRELAAIIAIRGGAFDVVGAIGTGDPIVAPTITLTRSGLLLAAFASDSECEFTTPSGMVPLFAHTKDHGPSIAVFSQELGAGATGTRTSEPSVRGNAAGILIGIKGA